MFTEAKVGDKVWSVVDGWGTIHETGLKGSYEISVSFEDGRVERYTMEGKFSIRDKFPSLFWNEIKFEIPKKPKQKVMKDLVVYVDVYQNDVFAYLSEEKARKAWLNSKRIATAVKCVGQYEVEE